jgi:TetR/AcrR family transcriptional regulator
MTKSKENNAGDGSSAAKVAKQDRSRKTQEKILAAAFEIFGRHGYKGASINMIAKHAGVGQPLVVYHFATKEALWIATVSWALDGFHNQLQINLDALEGLDPATRLCLIYKDFVRYSSKVPAMLEIMIDANKRREDLLAQIVETKLRPTYERLRTLIEAAQKTGSMPSGDPGLIYYSLIAVAATTFSLNREFKQLTGKDVLNPDMVEAQANLLARLFFPGVKQDG